jgi:hypothetical protein
MVSDTQFYWNLTKHIFRFSPSFDTDRFNGEHTVNEGKCYIVLRYFPRSCSFPNQLSVQTA